MDEHTKRKKILVVVDEIPFPPRNGITIPTSNYIKLLCESFTVEVLCIRDVNHEQCDEFLKKTQAVVSKVWIAERQRVAGLRPAIQEFLGTQPYFAAWEVIGLEKLLESLGMETFDAVLASPICMVPFAESLRKPGQRLVAGISDSYTGILKTHKLEWRKPFALPWGVLSRFRGGLMGRMERRILSNCDAVFVQTARDKAWLRSIGVEPDEKIVILSNGVHESLFDVQPDPVAPLVCVMAASFQAALYRENLEIFYKYVWPKVLYEIPGIKFRVVGRGLEQSPNLLAALKRDPAVELIAYREDIRDVYAGCGVSVAPIFKAYGIINKVVESLAAGVPVVGDRSAFNGIMDIERCGAVRIAQNPPEFAEGVCKLLRDTNWRTVALSGRELVRQQFAWAERKDSLYKAVLGGANE